MIIRVRAQCEEAFKQARRASSSPRDVSRLQQEFRESLRVARTIADSPEETAVAEEPQAALAADEIAPGSPVFVRSVRQNGEVLSPPDAAGNVTVRVGIIRTQVHMSDLASREPEERKALREQVSRLMATKAQQFAPELKIIGMTADEALDALDKYLDDAVLGSIKQVRIIHGKGTGTLRKAVQERLRSHPSVISQRPGGPGEGGDGATIAVLSE
jgi:DNA mismatch repair protein MutS2